MKNVFANGLLFASVMSILACSGKSSTSTVTTETETTITEAATEEMEEPYKGDLAMFWLSGPVVDVYMYQEGSGDVMCEFDENGKLLYFYGQKFSEYFDPESIVRDSAGRLTKAKTKGYDERSEWIYDELGRPTDFRQTGEYGITETHYFYTGKMRFPKSAKGFYTANGEKKEWSEDYQETTYDQYGNWVRRDYVDKEGQMRVSKRHFIYRK